MAVKLSTLYCVPFMILRLLHRPHALSAMASYKTLQKTLLIYALFSAMLSALYAVHWVGVYREYAIANLLSGNICSSKVHIQGNYVFIL